MLGALVPVHFGTHFDVVMQQHCQSQTKVQRNLSKELLQVNPSQPEILNSEQFDKNTVSVKVSRRIMANFYEFLMNFERLLSWGDLFWNNAHPWLWQLSLLNAFELSFCKRVYMYIFKRKMIKIEKKECDAIQVTANLYLKE